MSRWSLIAAALWFSPAAHAQVAPATEAQPTIATEPQDRRVVTQPFVSEKIVTIVSRVGVQSTVAFGPDESIENVAVGDSSTWQITPNKRATYLFVKPLEAHSKTNMTVVTTRRTYLFDLITSAKESPVYLLKFNYPDAPEETASKAEPVEATIEPRVLNFRWATRGKEKLYPSEIYDDGQSTYLTWPSGAPIPAILIQNRQGDEGPVNFAVRDDTIVVDGVPQLLILRSGKDRAILENKSEQRRASEDFASVSETARRKR